MRFVAPLLAFLLPLAGCSTAELLSARVHVVTVDPGQVFGVLLTDYRAAADDLVPKVGTLPEGFSLESQDGRSVVFRASIAPGVYQIPYAFVGTKDGVTASETSQIVVTVNAVTGQDSVLCDGSRVQLTLSFVHHADVGTVSTGAFVTGITDGPVSATLHRKNAAGDALDGGQAVSFNEGSITPLGTMTEADFSAYPILEFDVDSADPSDDWTCSVD